MARNAFVTRLKMLLGGKAQPQPPLSTPPAPPEPKPAPFNYDDDRIPSASRPRVAEIQKLLADIEEQAKLTTQGRDALQEARRIGHTYLPDLMNSYYLIPAEHRAEIFRRTGKSASFQLNERLDTMIEELKQISKSFAAGQIDSFSVNLRFIDQRFSNDGGNDPFSPTSQ